MLLPTSAHLLLHPMAWPCLNLNPAMDASATIIFNSTTIRFLLSSDSLAKQRTAGIAEMTIDTVQAVKDDYQVTLVGHSLGAGAAALLAMMLRAKGITNMHCYAFAPPMCCEPDLAASCSDHVTSVVFRDDIISRYCRSIVKCLEDLVLSVCSYCLLPPLLSPEDNTCNLMYCFISPVCMRTNHDCCCHAWWQQQLTCQC